MEDVPNLKLRPFSYLKLVAHLNVAVILSNNNLTLMHDQCPDYRLRSDLLDHLESLVENNELAVLLAHIDIVVVKQQTFCVVCFD